MSETTQGERAYLIHAIREGADFHAYTMERAVRDADELAQLERRIETLADRWESTPDDAIPCDLAAADVRALLNEDSKE